MGKEPKEIIESYKHLKNSEKPTALFLIAPPGSGKSFLAKKFFSKKNMIIDIDELREEAETPPSDPGYWRFVTQKDAERKRCMLTNYAVMNRIPFLITGVTGSTYWYEEALSASVEGYRVAFIFICTNREQIGENLEKRKEQEERERGWSLPVEQDFLEYSISSVPRLADVVIKDNMDVVTSVYLLDQNGKRIEIPSESIPEYLRECYGVQDALRAQEA